MGGRQAAALGGAGSVAVAVGAAGAAGAAAGTAGAAGMSRAGSAGQGVAAVGGSTGLAAAGGPAAGAGGAAPDAGARDAADAGASDTGNTEVDASTTADAGTQGSSGTGGRGAEPMQTPVYRIALRVHTGESVQTPAELAETLEEVNWIWWSQASVCFEIELVEHDMTMSEGFDFWYHDGRIPCSPGANGVYCGDHDIHSLDEPNLGRSDDAMWSVKRAPARTGAHELGHGLSLDHFDNQPDSNDSLMASGRMGFKLHESEIMAARRRAAMKALPDNGSKYCASVTPPTAP
jgi:hypothetical protein